MRRRPWAVLPFLLSWLALTGCPQNGGTVVDGGSGGTTDGGGGGTTDGFGNAGPVGTIAASDVGSVRQTASADYVVFAWNDLGMHCLNPTYDTAVILPPYNTVWAQVIRRGAQPQIVTSGLTIDYRILDNTSSIDKTYPAFGSDYGQFWQYDQDLFGVDLPPDEGLNLKDPAIHNSLSGALVAYGDHFEVDGIPLTPVDDSGTWDPYQVMELTVKDGSGNVVAQTHATVPTSDEIHCDSCHGSDPFMDVLQKHDAAIGTSLASQTPVLCASCHGSPALGQTGPGPAGMYLSEAIHRFHADKGATCYSCHPGPTTQCNRSLAHSNQTDGACSECHGTMSDVADSIANGRVPWASEPKCVTCHPGVAEVDTGSTLYRDATGHGGVSCAACHGSPHAMIPSRVGTDNYQAYQYQGKAVPIGSCAACHPTSRGRGAGEFVEEHGSGGNPSACAVCHTQVNSGNTAQWPHAFQWSAR